MYNICYLHMQLFVCWSICTGLIKQHVVITSVRSDCKLLNLQLYWHTLHTTVYTSTGWMLFINSIDTYNKEGCFFPCILSCTQTQQICLKTFTKSWVIARSMWYTAITRVGYELKLSIVKMDKHGPLVLGVTLQDLLASLCKSTLDD